MTTYSPPLPVHPRGPWSGSKPGLHLGLAISVLVHACVLAWLLHAAFAPVPPSVAVPAAPMHFVLVPPRPRAEVPVADAPAPAAPARPAATSRPARAASRRAAAPSSAPSASAPVITSGKPAAADAVQPTGIEPAPEPGTADAPRLDMPAALKTARLIEQHRKDGVVAFPKPDPPLQRDDRLERAIERAHRGNCQTAYSGLGLMAVIPLAKDTLTGTGCKW